MHPLPHRHHHPLQLGYHSAHPCPCSSPSPRPPFLSLGLRGPSGHPREEQRDLGGKPGKKQRGGVVEARGWPPHACELTAPPGTVYLCTRTQHPRLESSPAAQDPPPALPWELNTCWAVAPPLSHVSQATAEATQPPGSNPAHGRSESNSDCGWEKPVGQDDHLTLRSALFLELLSSGCHILM